MARGSRNKKAPMNMNEVWLPPQEELKDCMGEPWRIGGGPDPLNLRAVLLRTVRLCPVKTGEDAERTYNLVQAIKAENSGYIKMVKTDFDWMLKHFREMAHAPGVWNAPDAYWLVKHLGEIMVMAKPEDVPAE